MTFIPRLSFKDLHYDLPDERIALHPLEQRDHSKLLFYNNGQIRDYHFFDVPDLIPRGSLLVGNNTKVIPARLIFPLETGSSVELFLLTPLSADWTAWEVMVGNRRKFRDGQQLTLKSTDQSNLVLNVVWLDREKNTVKFHVSEPYSMPEALEILGQIPLPPYIKRELTHEDKERYQTVFAAVAGAVAAPTASLHFTDAVLQNLDRRGIERSYLTLHVGAGTFKPVKAAFASDHEMHKEQFHVTRSLVSQILDHLRERRQIIASGTTSMRVMESLFFVGARRMLGMPHPTEIGADEGFNPIYKKIGLEEALFSLLDYTEESGGSLSGNTSIFILPGFYFRVCTGLITNFHQPGSTLMALVAAFIGEDWYRIYGHAMTSGYRFLSYGDSSLLMRKGIQLG